MQLETNSRGSRLEAETVTGRSLRKARSEGQRTSLRQGTTRSWLISSSHVRANASGGVPVITQRRGARAIQKFTHCALNAYPPLLEAAAMSKFAVPPRPVHPPIPMGNFPPVGLIFAPISSRPLAPIIRRDQSSSPPFVKASRYETTVIRWRDCRLSLS